MRSAGDPPKAAMRWAARTALIAALGLATAAASSCAADRNLPPSGLNSFGQAQRYIKKAVRSSSEGVIILPSRRAESLFDLQRLNDIAQALRPHAAACFVNRAILTVKRGTRDGEAAYVDVPEGQAKIRTRLAPDGEVLRTEVLESGFKDTEIEPCIREAIQGMKWIPNRSGVVQYLDVIYWVSLGDGAEDRSPEALQEFRKQTALAAIRGKGCLEGRAAAGSYEVEGLNLLDREGNTLVTRIDPNPLSSPVRDCLAVVMRQIRMPRAPNSFIRPVSPRIRYTVAADGSITFDDEQWIDVLLLEEAALREERRAEVAEFTKDARPVDRGEPEPEPESEPQTQEPAEPAESPKDPSQGGIKLKLGGHRTSPR